MPPVSSPGLHDRQGTTRTRADERAARVRFRRAMALMLMTLLVPGSAQLVAGNRRVGRIALRIWLLLGVGFLGTVVTGLAWHDLAFKLAVNTVLLELLRIGLMLLAVGWAYLFLDAWRIGQPLTLSMSHRRAVVGVNGLLCLAVAGTLLFGAHLVGVQRNLMLSMFGTLDERGARLPRRTECELLRIAQEALGNVHKHAGAINVWVRLAVTGNDVRLVVEDDGVGSAAPRAGHYGLHTMRERSERINADLKVGIRPDGGTVVTVQSRPSVTTPKGEHHDDTRVARR